MKRKLISIFIILAMLQVMTTQIVTASKQDELQDVKDKVSEATQRKNDIVAEKDDIVNEISNLEDSISEYETESSIAFKLSNIFSLFLIRDILCAIFSSK